MRRIALAALGVLLAGAGLSLPDTTAPAALENTAPLAQKEALHYGVEWRLIRAGIARLNWTPSSPGAKSKWEGGLHVESAGLVSKLHKVNDDYVVDLADGLCAESVLLRAQEGKRNRETKVSFDRARGKAHYLERDLIKNTTVLAKEIDVPACVHDVIGGLYRLRTMRLEPGQSAQVPMTDGKKFASVKVEAQERETVKTPAGTWKTIRYEAFLFNGALYARNARCFVWITDDARRLPVQLQVRLRFLIGTITLALEKDDRS